MTTTIHIKEETAHRLRMYVAQKYAGAMHGRIGTTAELAINQFIDNEINYYKTLPKDPHHQEEPQ